MGLLIGYGFNGIEQTGVMSSGQGAGKTVVFSILIDARTILIGVGFTLIIGFIGGLLPAFSAMRLKLLDSLQLMLPMEFLAIGFNGIMEKKMLLQIP